VVAKSQYKRFKARFLARLAKQGTDVTLTWVTLTGVTVDATTGARLGTPTSHSQIVKGFIHFPEIAATSGSVQFAEIEAGDCIVDLHPDTVIEGLESLTFEINGEKWVQKKTGGKLAKTWDTVYENTRFCRTLLLRKAT